MQQCLNLLFLLFSWLRLVGGQLDFGSEVTAQVSWESSPSTTTAENAHEVYALDSKGNGEIQLIVAPKDGQNLYLLTPYSGDRTVINENTQLSVTYPTSGTGGIFTKVKAVAVGTVTRDGYPDIIVADEGGGGVAQALDNSYGGGFGFSGHDYPVSLPGTCKKIIALRIVDLDGDGCNDVIAACKDDDRPGYYKQTCIGGQATISIGENWAFLNGDSFTSSTNMDSLVDIDSGDFDNDGQRDIVIVMDKDGSFGVAIFLLNDITDLNWSVKQMIAPTQEGSASSFVSGISNPNKIASIAVCDVDNDGDLDIFLLWKHGDTLGFLENLGGGGGGGGASFFLPLLSFQTASVWVPTQP